VRNADTRPVPKPECPREAELLEALQTAAGPDYCRPGLRDHVAACPSCAELQAVVLPLLDEHHSAMTTALVPPSGAVWWRAQMRARQEAARTAARPISIAQAIGLACAIGVLAGGFTLLAPTAVQWFGWTASLAEALLSRQPPSVTWSELQWIAPATVAVLLALTMMFVLAPVALYLAVKGET
jgi:hypothetical protein